MITKEYQNNLFKSFSLIQTCGGFVFWIKIKFEYSGIWRCG